MEESAILSSMAASNPRWLAPEILSGRGYTFSSDVYSFGVIMWEFLTWQIPWHECGPWQVCTHTILSCHHCFTAASATVVSGGFVSGQKVCYFVRVDSTGHCARLHQDTAPACHAVCKLHLACLMHRTCTKASCHITHTLLASCSKRCMLLVSLLMH